MAETGVVRLDPRAQEFRPRNPNQNHQHQNHNHQPAAAATTFFAPAPPPPVYFPYGEVPVMPLHYHSIPPPPPPPPPPAATSVSPPLPPPCPTATRALVLSSVPRGAAVSESMLRMELEVFGEVRAVQMERLLRDGIVTIHFYDLRHAKRALRAIQEQHLQCYGGGCGPCQTLHGLIAGQPVWAQFVIPAINSIPEGQNQGTIVIFNLDPDVSTSSLRQIFEAFGPVKELRDTPYKKHQRFVEFYDVRDAARALTQMNGKEIHGKSVIIEFSRPGGHNRKLFLNAASAGPSSINQHPSSSSSSSSLLFHHNSLLLYNTSVPNYHTEISNNPPSVPRPPPLPHCLTVPAAAPPRPREGQMQKPNKKSPAAARAQVSPRPKKGSVETTMASLSLEDECCKENVFSNRKSSGGTVVKKNKHGSSVNKQQQQSCRPWSKSKHSKKLDLRFIINDMDEATVETDSGDCRTTLMIKNIPNKYSQKLLLNMLDNHCIHCNEQIGEDHGDDESEDHRHNQPCSAYDFVYLPIDFNNKCNVGYGFVNMTTPQAARRLYKAFHLRHWEVFNSRKICEVTYARIQGLEALKEHFKNSKFPCETEHYLPVVFDPPRDGRRLTDPLPIVGHHHHYNHKQQDQTVTTSPQLIDDEVEGGLGAGPEGVVNRDDLCSRTSDSEEEGKEVEVEEQPMCVGGGRFSRSGSSGSGGSQRGSNGGDNGVI